MQVPDYVPKAEAECATQIIPGRRSVGFTRALFHSNGGVHTESRCNQCGFAISGNPERLDNEEQEHAHDCQGSWME